MFKKKPQIKNLSPLRSSDRRKLADQIISDFHIHIPPPTPAGTAEAAESTGQHPPPPPPPPEPSSTDAAVGPTLSSIRASLIPETCLSARFTTHAGADLKLVSGTIYVGAHPGHEERILWIQIGQNDPRLYPTVYTLWHNPGIVPLLHTQEFVVHKLRTGADLMTPGLVGRPPFDERATKNAIVAVASLERPTVPAVVGVCEIDVSALASVQGAKGHAVRGVHWDSDEIWAWSQAGVGGRPPPESLQGWVKEGDVARAMDQLDLDDGSEAQEDGGVSIAAPGQSLDENNPAINSGDNGADDREPTTQEIDDAFFQAFLYGLYDAKKTGSPPHYGIDFPITPSLLISNIIQPHLRIQSPHYTIKKTSWKNTKKLIKHLDKQQLVKSKDRSGGETVILDADFNDPKIQSFTPYKLPKPKLADSSATPPSSSAAGAGTDPSLGQRLHLVSLIRPSSKLVPTLLPSKTAFYTPAQVSAAVRSYIDANPALARGVASPQNVKLDPFLANNILGTNVSMSDTKALAAGEISRAALLRRVLDDHNLCAPYWAMLRDDQKWPTMDSIDAATAAAAPQPQQQQLPKPQSGAAPRASVTIERRTGAKLVTRIAHLEAFGVPPGVLAGALQRACASSTSVAQLVGGKPGAQEILVQGEQAATVLAELARRGVRREWIDVLDKTKAKKGDGARSGGGGGGGRR